MDPSSGHGIQKRGDRPAGLTGAGGARGLEEESAFYGRNHQKSGSITDLSAIGGAYGGERAGTGHFGG